MSYSEEDKEYLLKIIKAVIIIETHIINNPKIKEFILSIANDDIITKLDTIQNAESQNYIARNKLEEDTIFIRLSSLVNAIIYITYFLHLLTDFYAYTEDAMGKNDIIFGTTSVSEIKNIVPTLLTNKQAIIANLYYVYNSKSKKEDIEFYNKFFNRNKVNHEYTSRSNPMAAAPKTIKYRRHKRGSLRRKRVSKRRQ
jgi:hydroxymethylglutaryl-CoA reductase